MPWRLVRWTVWAPCSAWAIARQVGAMAGKSASMPPRTSISSVKWVSTSPRAPCATASLTAWVWVMDLPTTHKKTSAAFIAAAAGAGGSCPSRSRGRMLQKTGSPPAAQTAAPSSSAMLMREGSVTISTVSPGFTLAQRLTTVCAPFAIWMFLIKAPSVFVV